ncbi:MAG: glycosyltransferase family A protein [Christensenella sp.]|nr:glycosyltransferase family A protein [Christensenella sp.]
MTLISIALLCYNHEKLLPRNLLSFANQTDPDFELVLVDNQSTDQSFSVLEQFRVDHPEMKILAIQNNTKTVCEGRRVGFEASSGDYVALHDGDDWVEPTFVEAHRKVILEHHPDAIASGTKTISSSGKTLHVDALPQAETPWSKRTMQGYMLKREVFTSASAPFVNTFFEDLYLSSSLNRHIHSVWYIREPLYCYYVNDVSANSKARMQSVGAFVEPFDHACALIRQNLFSGTDETTQSLLEFQVICHYYSLVFAGSVYLSAGQMLENYKMLRAVIRQRYPKYLANRNIRLRGSNAAAGAFQGRLWLAAQLEKLDATLHTTLFMRLLLWVYYVALKLNVYQTHR